MKRALSALTIDSYSMFATSPTMLMINYYYIDFRKPARCAHACSASYLIVESLNQIIGLFAFSMKLWSALSTRLLWWDLASQRSTDWGCSLHRIKKINDEMSIAAKKNNLISTFSRFPCNTPNRPRTLVQVCDFLFFSIVTNKISISLVNRRLLVHLFHGCHLRHALLKR